MGRSGGPEVGPAGWTRFCAGRRADSEARAVAQARYRGGCPGWMRGLPCALEERGARKQTAGVARAVPPRVQNRKLVMASIYQNAG